MLTLLLISFFFILGVFCLVSFSFMVILLMTECLKVSLLLFTYFCSFKSSHMIYLVFIVVATMEVTVALVCLTRLWDTDCLVL